MACFEERKHIWRIATTKQGEGVAPYGDSADGPGLGVVKAVKPFF